MKSLNKYINEEKQTTGAGCVEMIKTILDQLTKEHPDCQYDTDIITELKPLLLPLKPVLEESSDYPEEEVNKTFDFALVIVDNIAHKYGERGQYFLDWWGNTDGTIDLVDQIANGTL